VNQPVAREAGAEAKIEEERRFEAHQATPQAVLA
jgi:hypothetical protein